MGQDGAPAALRRAAGVQVAALRRTASDPRLVRLQLSWAAVMVASWTATVSLSVVAYAEGGSAAVALAVLARTVPGVVVGPVVGALVDRFPRRKCLTVAALLCGLATAGAALGAGTLAVAIGLVTVVALVTMLFRTAQSAILPELVDDPAELTAANVLSSAVESVGVFAGPALGAALLLLQGPRLAFAVAAGLFVAAGLLVIRLPARPANAGAEAEASGRTRDLFRLPAARLVFALLLAQTVLSGGLVVLYPALAVDALRLDASAAGWLTAAYGLGGVVGSVGLFALAGSRRLGALTAAALLLWSLPLLLLPLGPALAVVLLLLAVTGGGNVLFDVTSVTLLQRGVPVRLLGRAFGVVETVVVIGLGGGAAVAPALDELVGPATTLAGMAAMLVVVTGLALRALHRLDRELTAPTRQVRLLRALPAFALLPPLQLERLALHLRRTELAAGAAAARQGEPGSTYFLVDTGRLGVEVDGRPVHDLGPGAAFGEIALLRSGVRTATVVAREPSVLWALDGDVFLAALRADGGRALAALDAVAEENLRRAAPAYHPSPNGPGPN
ncbi:MAG: transporter [Blastococcus sp.]|jgi:MFS family permease|nr:transporter [Blastococcus sp.]